MTYFNKCQVCSGSRISQLTAAVYLFDELKTHNEKLFAPYTKAKHFAFSLEPKKVKTPFGVQTFCRLPLYHKIRTFFAENPNEEF
jgi:hypothetical protein